MLQEWAVPEQQEARSVLRSKFLRTLHNFLDKKCTILLYDNSQVQATFSGCDVETQNILVSNLHTPNGLLESAVLRATDIIHISFEVDDSSK